MTTSAPCEICHSNPAEFGRYCASCIDKELSMEDLESLDASASMLGQLLRGDFYTKHEEALEWLRQQGDPTGAFSH